MPVPATFEIMFEVLIFLILFPAKSERNKLPDTESAKTAIGINAADKAFPPSPEEVGNPVPAILLIILDVLT